MQEESSTAAAIPIIYIYCLAFILYSSVLE
jgi:hypothetical protein